MEIEQSNMKLSICPGIILLTAFHMHGTLFHVPCMTPWLLFVEGTTFNPAMENSKKAILSYQCVLDDLI